MKCDTFKLASGHRAPPKDPKTCWGDRIELLAGGETAHYCGNELDNEAEIVSIDSSDTASVVEFDFVVTKQINDAGFRCTIMTIDTNPPPVVIPPNEPTNPDGNCPCGKKGKPESNRIVSGTETNENEWPWQVALVQPGSDRPFCGGSIINDRYILTAAHCTAGKNPSSIDIIVGEHDWTTKNDGQKKYDVAEIKDHQSYNSQTINNDFSLIRLSEPLTWSDQVRPVCLPADNSDQFVDEWSVVTGWGTTSSGGSQPPVLQEVVLETMSNAECRSLYGSSTITNQMMCATGAAPALYSKDSCQGDSGGPLVGKNADNRFELRGVVSWGYGCASAGNPGVYARVSTVLPWIESETQDAEYCV